MSVNRAQWPTYGPVQPGEWYKRHSRVDGKDVDDKFDVAFAKRGGLTGFLVITFLLLGLQFLAFDSEFRYLFVIFAPLTLVPLGLWRWLSPQFAVYTLLNWLRKTVPQNKKMASPLEMFYGCPPTRNPYFIEGNPQDLDLSNWYQVLERIQEVVFLSIGTNIFIARVLGLLVPARLLAHHAGLDLGWNQTVMATALHLGPLSLIFLSFLVPMFWIAEDCQIFRIDDYQDPGMFSLSLFFLPFLLFFLSFFLFSSFICFFPLSVFFLYLFSLILILDLVGQSVNCSKFNDD
jgi:hypothetical protein